MNIYQIFEAMAIRYPDHPAIIEDNKVVTYSGLRQLIVDYSAYLTSKRISKGDRVMVFVPMGIEMYKVVLSLFSIGAITVFLDEWVSWKRLNICCALADCKGFIGNPMIRFLGLFSSEVRKIPIKLNVKTSKKGSNNLVTEVEESHPALITFTTGSTGTPKAALRSHGFLYSQFKVLKDEINTLPETVFMTTLPILVLINLGCGITTVLPDKQDRKPDQMRPEIVLKLLIKHQVIGMVTSPALVIKLAEYLLISKTNLPMLQKIFVGGAPVFPIYARNLIQAFEQIKIGVFYGSTEAEPISSIDANSIAADEAMTSLRAGLPAGFVNQHIQLKIIEYIPTELNWEAIHEIKESSLARPGEIIVSGPHVLDKYFKNESAFKRNKIIDANGNCWHRTGDSGYLDKENRLFLTGRCDQLIYCKDVVLCPFIYEAKLLDIAGIRSGTLIQWNDEILFVIEIKETADSDSIVSQINTWNPNHFPIKIVSQIPRDPRHQSKTDYGALKLMLTKNS